VLAAVVLLSGRAFSYEMQREIVPSTTATLLRRWFAGQCEPVKEADAGGLGADRSLLPVTSAFSATV
jgi:hypothetical protein